MTNIYDILGNVVGSMRTTGSITAIVDNADGTYTITTTKTANDAASTLNLANNDYVTISDTPNFNGQYKISNVDLNNRTFDITKATGAGISTLGTFTANAPYYDFEKWQGESNKLTKQNLSNTYALQKFPLVFLLLDISQLTTGQTSYVTPDFTIYIVDQTRPHERANWRLDNIYENNLFQLKDLFIKKLFSNRYITQTEGFSHTVTDRFFLGTSDNNQNKLNQYVDAVEISFTGIRFKVSSSLNCSNNVRILT